MSRSYKLLLLASLYLAQGLPYGFFTQALPVLLREQGLSLTAISATSLLFLPWALKFLWAPFLDCYGSRKAWLLPLQALAALLAASLALLPLGEALWPLMLALLLFNLIAATQDVATDGLAVNLLSTRERGLGNGLQVGGYRLGMVLGGGLLLWVYARLGADMMFALMALLLAAAALVVLPLREPRAPLRPAAMGQVAGDWWRRLRQPGMVGFVFLICFYKFGDAMGAAMVGPFMRDLGLTREEIAVIKGTLGSGSTLIGAALGGWMAWRLGRRPALLLAGILQSISLLPYALAAAGAADVRPLIIAGSLSEHVLGGMATVALFTLMMDASEPAHAGTDYTLLACAIVLAQGLAVFSAGAVGDALGYVALFALSLIVSLAGCLTLVLALDRGLGPARVHPLWRRHSAA